MKLPRFFTEWGWIILLAILTALWPATKVVSDFISCDPATKPCLANLALGALGGVAYVSVWGIGIFLSRRSARANRLTELQTEVQRLLASAIKALFKDESSADIRANVMLIQPSKQLRIVWAVNMEPHAPEISVLAFKKGQGASGVAWELADRLPEPEGWRPVIAPKLENVDTTRWGITPSQKQLTSRLKWIISTPIIHRGRVVGIVNFDSVGEKAPTIEEAARNEFRDPIALANICRQTAELVSDFLGRNEAI